MIRAAALLLFATLVPPQDEAARAAALIEKLRSEKIDERDQAVRGLKSIGDPARPVLEKAAADPDAEVAALARKVLRLLDLRAALGPALLAALPGVDDRLDSPDPHAWTDAFLEATARKGVHRRHPELRRRDLEPLGLRALEGARAEEWVDVLHLLAAWELRSAASALLPLLDSENPKSSSGAFEARLALGCLAEADLAPRLLERARATSKPLWKSAILLEAAQLDPDAAFADLLPLLGTDNVGVPSPPSPQMLRAFRTPKAVPSLAAFGKDPLSPLASQAIAILVDLDPALALRLIELDLEKKPDPRREGYRLPLLAHVQDPALLPLLTRLVAHPDKKVRNAVVLQLGKTAGGDARPVLRKLLADPEPEIRDLAFHQLLLLNDRDRIPEALERLAKDPDSTQLLWALGRMAAPGALPLARQIVRDGNRSLQARTAAAYVLGQLHDRESAADLEALLKVQGEEPREVAYMHGAALEALAALGPVGLPALERHPKDDQNGEYALLAIALQKGEKVLPEVLALFNRKGLNSHYYATTALAAMPVDVARREFRKLLETEESPDMISSIIHFLGILGCPESLPHFRALLTHPWVHTRQAAAEALCLHGVAEGWDALLEGTYAHVPALTLNFQRRPEAWKRLAAKALDGPLQGSGEEVLRAVAEKAGLALEASGALLDQPGSAYRFDKGSLLDVLREVLRWNQFAVLEDDRIRLLPEEEARRFWRRYWAELQLQSTDLEVHKNGERIMAGVRREEAQRAALVTAARTREESEKKAAASAGSELEKVLTPALRAVPRLVERLSLGTDEAWTELFSELGKPAQWKVLRSLSSEDLAVLSPRAFRGARTPQAKMDVLAVVWTRRLVPSRPEVSALLDDPVPAVRQQALQALIQLRAREEIPKIAALLASKDQGTVEAALGALQQLEARERLPEMKALLEDPQVGFAAARTLAHWKVPEALPTLVRYSKHQDRNTRLFATLSLCSLGGKEIVPIMMDVLKDSDPSLAEFAVTFLAEDGRTESVEDIAALFDRKDHFAGDMARSAIRGIQRLGARDRAPRLLRLLKDATDHHTRMLAGECLADMKVREALPLIRGWLDQKEGFIAEGAIPLLVQYGDRESLPKIRALLGSSEFLLNGTAARALVALEGPKAALSPIREAQKAATEDFRPALLEVLARIAPEEALPELRESMKDRRQSGYSVLLELRQPEARPIVERWLEDESGQTRAWGLQALHHLDGPAALPRLRSELRGNEEGMRVAAAKQLVLAGEKEGVPLVLESTTDLFSLNAVRQPALWARLSTLRLEETLYGTAGELLQALSQKLGVGLEVPRFQADALRRWDKVHHHMGSAMTPQTFVSHLDHFAWFVVREPDRLRVLPWDQAPDFWKSWWEAESAKK